MWSGGDRRRFVRTFGEALERLGCKPEATATARTAFKALLGPLPLVTKKDAHPDNWLIDQDGRVVMIDLEAQSPVPILLELVLLVDDAPLLDPNEDGFERRLEIAHAYLERLEQAASHLRFEVDPLTIYETFALYVVVTGLVHVRGARRRANSSFLRQATDLREAHLLDLCQVIAGAQRTVAADAAALTCQAMKASGS
jgi:hypothetical protein